MKLLLLALSLFLFTGCVAEAATHQTAPRNNPADPRLLPIADAISSSSINTVIFRHSPLVTFRDTQYAAFYDNESHVVLAKRRVGTEEWEMRRTDLTGNTKDAHNTISLGIDGGGIVHLAWDHHGADLNYVQTKEAGSLELTGKLPMDGQRENQVTYPEFYNLPVKNADGTAGPDDLLFLYRVGTSGNGDLVLKRYRTAGKKWETVVQNLVAGKGGRTLIRNLRWDRMGPFTWRGFGGLHRMWPRIMMFVMPSPRMRA